MAPYEYPRPGYRNNKQPNRTGVGWTVPESLTLRVISPRLPELKIRMWHTYGAFWHDLWYKSIMLIPSTGNTLNVRVSPSFTPENRPSFESEPENRPSVEPDKLKKNINLIYTYNYISLLFKASTYPGLIRGPSRMGVPVRSGCNSRLFLVPNMRGSSYRGTWVYNG